MDGNTVEAGDLGNNFFVTESDLGKPRAEVVAGLLQELNEDVNASNFMNEPPEQLISNRPEFFDSFTAVVATQLAEAPLRILAERCVWRALENYPRS